MCDVAAFALAGVVGEDSPNGIAAANPFAAISVIASTNTSTRATAERAMRRGAGTKLVKSAFTAEMVRAGRCARKTSCVPPRGPAAEPHP